jgi:hypothetical protein
MDWWGTENYPRRWSDMAIDYKLMFVLHIAIMIQFALGQSLTIAGEAAVQGGLIAAALAVAIWIRQKSGWRWRGIGIKHGLGAVLICCLVGLFLGAAMPLDLAVTPQMFPWCMGAIQIGLFGMLTKLRIARLSQQDFLADCDPHSQSAELAPPESAQATWRVWARRIYSIAFLAIWLDLLAFFYFHRLTIRDGAAFPDAIMTTAMTDHGDTVYVTAADWARDRLLLLIGTAGIPIILVSGAILQFVFRVPIFPIAAFSRSSPGR